MTLAEEARVYQQAADELQQIRDDPGPPLADPFAQQMLDAYLRGLQFAVLWLRIRAQATDPDRRRIRSVS